MTLTLTIVLAAIAGALWFWKVGQGKSNWGPRLTAVAMLAAGAGIAGMISPWLQTISSAVGNFLAGLVASFGSPELAALLRTLGQNLPWLAGIGLLVLWGWALLPGKLFAGRRMDWRIALGAVLIPALIVSVPSGPLRNVSQTVVTSVSAATANAASTVLGGRY